MGMHELLFREDFVNKVLHGGVHVAFVVWTYYVLSELGKQRRGKIMQRQAHWEILLVRQHSLLLLHGNTAYDVSC
jgi:hypothetical protein